ncbi:beta-galactosidase-1-like protein [Chrysoperla carnea]|uniref:beta-galactosidase-1-like protein n=1 Tax=Chrysoperla carnea TaxID=189513 RepID=UPI001D078FA6|nr:beta-galactosidase-1-like protein [Chrysoperla carnea]
MDLEKNLRIKGHNVHLSTTKPHRSTCHPRNGSSITINIDEPSITLKSIDTTQLTKIEKLRFIAGEIHYFRIPYMLWFDRLQRMKLGGITVVAIPIEWATHEPKNNEFHFEKNGDIFNFLNHVKELEMRALIKIGPYIDADRELGGLPAWLLFENVSSDAIWLRTNNQIFKRYYERWLRTLFREIENFTFEKGALSWHEPHTTLSSTQFENLNRVIEEILNGGTSIIYMYTGGTTFGLANGLKTLQDDGTIPIYGQDAPLNPNGNPTNQYYNLRNIIRKVAPDQSKYSIGQSQIDIELQTKYPTLEFEAFGSLLCPTIKNITALPPIINLEPKIFRELKQNGGFILYETLINFEIRDEKLLLKCTGIRDRGYVYFQEKFAGILGSRNGKILLKNLHMGDILYILVENNGRLSKGFRMNNDLKGIFKPVILTTTSGISLSAPQRFIFPKGPLLYRSVFFANSENYACRDSYLNVQSLGKGIVFLNGHILGPYWSSFGSPLSVYIPGVFINPYPRENIVIILELENAPVNNFILRFVRTPVFLG